MPLDLGLILNPICAFFEDPFLCMPLHCLMLHLRDNQRGAGMGT